MKTSAIAILMGCMFTAFPSFLSAQKSKDSMDIMREFVDICQLYKQNPLQLHLEYRNTTNYITGAEDTITIEGKFYNTAAGAYIRFGEMEQIVHDSIALIVSDKLKRMVLFSNAASIIAQMKSRMGMPLPDSSIISLSQKYRATKTVPETGTHTIELESRWQLMGTTLPKERIALQYDARSKEPMQVTLTKRSLLPVPDTDSTEFIKKYGPAGQLVRTEGNGLFLIKEQATVFLFRKIEHDYKAPMPVQMADRIVKNEAGTYVPAKGYESFSIKQNN